MGEKIELRGRLDGRQRNRLKSLLNMMYRPSEIAEEIGFSIHQVYRAYLPLGCPHSRDSRGHIWINGKEFHDWYQKFYKKRKLRIDEAFCLTCKKAVEKIDPIRKWKNGLIYEISICPICGRKLAKIINRKR
jgi:hypothetical protein